MTIELPDTQSPRHEPQIFSEGRRQASGRRDPAAEVGFFLRRERELRGLAIEVASDSTGIHPYHIDAIEEGDLTRMPPRIEAMEMIAGYAQYLGFEPEPLIEHLASFLPPPPIAKPKFHPARPPILSSAKILSFGKMPKIPSLNINLSKFPGGNGGIVSSVAAAFMILAGAHWALSGSAPSVTAPAPEQVAVAAPQVVQPAAPVADAMPTASTNTADVKVSDVPMPDSGKISSAAVAENPDAMGNFIQDQVQPPAQPQAKAKPGKVASKKIQDRIKIEDQMKTATAVPVPQPSDGRVYGAENKDARIILKATAPVWLRIEDAQGNAVMTQMLNTGDSYRVPNRDGLIALSRDGGRLAFSIDGQDKGVLGPPGKILVSEKLDVAALDAKGQGGQASAN